MVDGEEKRFVAVLLNGVCDIGRQTRFNYSRLYKLDHTINAISTNNKQGEKEVVFFCQSGNPEFNRK